MKYKISLFLAITTFLPVILSGCSTAGESGQPTNAGNKTNIATVVNKTDNATVSNSNVSNQAVK